MKRIKRISLALVMVFCFLPSSFSPSLIASEKVPEVSTLLPAGQVNSEWKDNWGERAAWARRQILRNKEGYFDMFDHPMKVGGEFIVTDMTNGQRVDIEKEYTGKNIACMFINTKGNNIWNKSDRIQEYIDEYRRMYEDYSDKEVSFLTVWIDNSKKGKSDREQAKDFFKKHNIPGTPYIYKLERRKCPYFDIFRPLFILRNSQNLVLFRQQADLLSNFRPQAYALMIQRLLDADFNTKVYSEFPDESRHLPTVEKTKSALIYRDSFESYRDDRSLKLSPRWGFHYYTQYSVDGRPQLKQGEGRKGSAAALVHGFQKNCPHPAIEHDMPVPLKDGGFAFYIKAQSLATQIVRSKSEMFNWMGELTTQVIIDFRGSESVVPAGYLLIKNNTFVFLKENPLIRSPQEKGKVNVSKDWHKISIEVQPNKATQLKIDDVVLGKLNTKALLGIRVRCFNGSSVLLDDVKISYKGDGEHQQQLHRTYEQDSRKVQVGQVPYPYTKEEEEVAVYDNLNISERDFKYFYIKPHFKKPLTPNGTLILEKMYKPGEYVNINEVTKQKATWMHCSLFKSPSVVLNRSFSSTSPMAMAVLDKTVWDKYHQKANLYALPASYHMGDMLPSPDDLRANQVEANVAKQFILETLGTASCSEVIGFYGQDNYLLRPTDHRMLVWSRIKYEGYWGGSHGGVPVGILCNTVLKKGGGIIDFTSFEFPWIESQFCLEAAMNDDYRLSAFKSFASGTPLGKTKDLPIIKDAEEGVLKADDFEGYENTLDLAFHPRWGYRYENILIQKSFCGGSFRGYTKQRDVLAPGKGRGGGTALWVNDFFQINMRCFSYFDGRDFSLESTDDMRFKHHFSDPLTNGHFKLYLRQGPKSVKETANKSGGANKGAGFKKEDWFYLDLLGEDGNVLDTITTTGWPRQKAGLKLERNKSSAIVSIAIEKWKQDIIGDHYPQDTTWHELNVIATPSQNIEVYVDNVLLGELPAKSLYGFGFRRSYLDSMYIDDIEIFHKK